MYSLNREVAHSGSTAFGKPVCCIARGVPAGAAPELARARAADPHTYARRRCRRSRITRDASCRSTRRRFQAGRNSTCRPFGARGVRALRIALEPPLLAAVEQAGRRSLEWSWTTGSQAVNPLMRVAVRLCGSDASENDVLDDLQDALAALGSNQPRGKVNHSPSAWLRRVREHIDDCHGFGLRLSDLALSADVHPVYLARRFRAYYGCSVGEYIRWRRVIAAMGLLRNHRAPIADVAIRVGCSDQPHLTRVVRAATGVTPAVLRRLMTLPSTEVQSVQDDTGTLPLASTE